MCCMLVASGSPGGSRPRGLEVGGLYPPPLPIAQRVLSPTAQEGPSIPLRFRTVQSPDAFPALATRSERCGHGDSRFTLLERTSAPRVALRTSGWRAACVHAHIKRTTGELHICKFGVEMPIENHDGPISTPLAQRVAAECANQAAYSVLRATTPETPLILACKSFRDTYDMIINSAIAGAQIKRVCHEKTIPYEFGL